MPKLTIVIGANGAGKSTWCERHREELPIDFYNADSIARGLGDWNNARKQPAVAIALRDPEPGRIGHRGRI